MYDAETGNVRIFDDKILIFLSYLVIISKFVNIPKDSRIARQQIGIRMGVLFLKWRSKVQIVQKLLLWKITGMKMAIKYFTPMHL